MWHSLCHNALQVLPRFRILNHAATDDQKAHDVRRLEKHAHLFRYDVKKKLQVVISRRSFKAILNVLQLRQYRHY